LQEIKKFLIFFGACSAKGAGWKGAKVLKEKEAGLRRIPLQPANICIVNHKIIEVNKIVKICFSLELGGRRITPRAGKNGIKS